MGSGVESVRGRVRGLSVCEATRSERAARTLVSRGRRASSFVTLPSLLTNHLTTNYYICSTTAEIAALSNHDGKKSLCVS